MHRSACLPSYTGYSHVTVTPQRQSRGATPISSPFPTPQPRSFDLTLSTTHSLNSNSPAAASIESLMALLVPLMNRLTSPLPPLFPRFHRPARPQSFPASHPGPTSPLSLLVFSYFHCGRSIAPFAEKGACLGAEKGAYLHSNGTVHVSTTRLHGAARCCSARLRCCTCYRGTLVYRCTTRGTRWPAHCTAQRRGGARWPPRGTPQTS